MYNSAQDISALFVGAQRVFQGARLRQHYPIDFFAANSNWRPQPIAQASYNRAMGSDKIGEKPRYDQHQQ
jgi:hypothetical protein